MQAVGGTGTGEPGTVNLYTLEFTYSCNSIRLYVRNRLAVSPHPRVSYDH